MKITKKLATRAKFGQLSGYFVTNSYSYVYLYTSLMKILESYLSRLQLLALYLEHTDVSYSRVMYSNRSLLIFDPSTSKFWLMFQIVVWILPSAFRKRMRHLNERMYLKDRKVADNGFKHLNMDNI